MTSSLPTHLTSFVGREQEATLTRHLLTDARLLTLTGPGGCGKTRLAIQVASNLPAAYPDGLLWVELAPLTDGNLVVQTVASALGVQDRSGRALVQVLADSLAHRKVLLVLDNCEHLIAACAALAANLLRACPGLQILATSREPLGVPGEVSFSVPPLALPGSDLLPDDGAPSTLLDPVTLARLAEVDSVSLFVDRAANVTPGFSLTPENARPIAHICRRLDGLPLAIELVSARVNVLSVQQIAERLDDRFSLLVSGPRHGVEPRHQTMRATIDWSYDLLSSQERLLLQRLAVFEAGCTLDMAEAICSGDRIGQSEILDLLSSLAARSLLVAETTGRAQARYRLLESIRDYGREKLATSGQADRLSDRHLDWFAAQVQEIGPKLKGPYQQLWLAWLDGEYDNLRAALRWALESGRVETGLALAAALYDFWLRRGYLREGQTWSQRLLERAGDRASALLRAKAHTTIAHSAWTMGDFERARKEAQTSIELAEAAGDEGKPYLARLLMGHSSNIRAGGDLAAAFGLCAKAIALLREYNDLHGLVPALILQGVNATGLGDYDHARALLHEGLALARELEDQLHIGLALKMLGDLAYCLGDYRGAQTAYQQGLEHYLDSGRAVDIAGFHCSLGHACLQLGDLPRALDLFRGNLETQQSAGNSRGLAETLLGFGALAQVQGRPETAVQLLSAAVALGGMGVLHSTPALRRVHQQHLGAAQAALPATRFARARQSGQLLTAEQAVELALEFSTAPTRPFASPGGLTPRQLEVAGLITRGHTNPEIADHLVLSKRTVEKHVANILAQLDVTNRAEIVRWGMEQGLA